MQSRRNTFHLLLTACLTLLTGCSAITNFAQECDTDSDCDGGGSCVTGFCEAPDGLPQVVVNANIDSDTTWTSDKEWVLEGLVTVLPSVTLTIEKGTRILGRRGAALVAREGGVIEAVGTRTRPIIFTSSKPVGQRQTGDWGGVSMMGKAPVNRENATLRLIPDEAEARFGGPDASWNCGSLRYVRIEFGGGQVEGEEALNGLTLAGCGRQTRIDHVHVHYGADDGVEIFGGTVDMSYVLVTRAQDDALDIDLGWKGRAQYVAIQQDSAADNAIEVDNLAEDPTRPPFTDFRISNFTIIGPKDMGLTKGITVKAGGAGFFTHGIVMGSTVDAVDVVGPEAGARAMNEETIVRDTIFFDVGPSGSDFFPVAGVEGETGDGAVNDDDAGFAEDAFFVEQRWGNKLGVDPGIAQPYDLTDPGWTPSGEAISDIERPPSDFEQTGIFHGAFPPNVDPWTEDWTAFPGG